jgi:hypothetical protein
MGWMPPPQPPTAASLPASFDRVVHVEHQVDLLHKFLQQQQQLMEVLVSMMAVKNRIEEFGGKPPVSKEEQLTRDPPLPTKPAETACARPYQPFQIQRRAAV